MATCHCGFFREIKYSIKKCSKDSQPSYADNIILSKKTSAGFYPLLSGPAFICVAILFYLQANRITTRFRKFLVPYQTKISRRRAGVDDGGCCYINDYKLVVGNYEVETLRKACSANWFLYSVQGSIVWRIIFRKHTQQGR